MRIKAKGDRRRLGERLVTEFSEFRDALRAGKKIDKRYTVKTVELDLKPKQFDAEDIKLVRLSLGVSQSIFAQLLGVSADLVASWEQAVRAPSGPACRILELMEMDKGRWLKILEQGTSRKVHQRA